MMGPFTISDSISQFARSRKRVSFRVNFRDGSHFDIYTVGVGWQYCGAVGAGDVPKATAVGGWARHVRVHTESADAEKIHIQLYDMSSGEANVRMSITMRPEDVVSIEPLGVRA